VKATRFFLTCFALISIVILCCSGGVLASETTLFEHTFQRVKGKPVTEEVSFPIQEPSGFYIITIMNGDEDGSNRCSSAVIIVNGVPILSQADLNQNVHDLDRSVDLADSNVMTARLTGKPGSFITVRIFAGEDDGDDDHKHHKNSGELEITSLDVAPNPFSPNGDGIDDITTLSAAAQYTGKLKGRSGYILRSYWTIDTEMLTTVTAVTDAETGPWDIVIDWDGSGFPEGTYPYEFYAELIREGKEGNGRECDDREDEDRDDHHHGNKDKDHDHGDHDGKENDRDHHDDNGCGDNDHHGHQTEKVVAQSSIVTGTIVIDLTAPVVTITQPLNGQVLANTPVDVIGTVDDPVAELTVNGTPTPNNNGAFTSNIDIVYGENIITASAVDPVGNAGSTSVTVILDNVPPIITLTPLAEYTSDTVAVLNGTIADLTATTVSVQGQTVSVPAGGGPFTFTVDLIEGLNTLTVTATDSAGNTSQASATTTRDTIAPVVTITVPADGAYIAALAAAVSGSIVDATPTTVQINGQDAVVTGDVFDIASITLVEGANTITATATDAAGNTGSNTITITADTIAPVITIDPLPEYVSATTVQLTGRVDDATATTASVQGTSVSIPAGGGPFSFTVDLAVEGLNTITVTATDSADNASTQDATTTRDTIPPVIQITAPLDGAFIGQLGSNVSGTVTDATPTAVSVNGSDAAVNSGAFSASYISMVEGANTIRAIATDAAGNIGTDEITVTADTIPPAITIDPLPEYTGATPLSVTGRIDDATPVIATLQGRNVNIPAGGGPFTFSADLIEGMNTLTVSAVDSAGNSSQEARTTILDTIPPAVDITNPADGDFLAEAITPVAGSVIDATPFTVSVNGTDAVLNGSAFTIDALPLVEGSNTITATAVDSAGNTGSSEITVISDVTAPVITIEPLPQYTATPTIELRGTVTDLTETTVSIQGSSISVPAGGGPFTFTVTLSEGPNTLTVHAVDSAGNSSEGSVSTILDTIPPALSITSPAGGAYLSMIATPVSGTVTDATPVTVSVNGQAAVLTDTQYNVASVSLIEGVNAIQAVATDAAGNTSTADITVIADTIPPVVTITAPQDGMKTNVPVQTVTGTVNDASPIQTANLNGTPLTFASPDYSIDHTLEEGLNTLTVEAQDMAGNTGSASIMVTLDTIPPNPPIIDDHPALTNQIQLTITGSAEALSLVKIAGQGEDYADASGVFSIPITLNADVMNTFSATATDDVGNESLPTTFSILQDSTPPFVTDFNVLADPKVTLIIPLSITFSEELDTSTINTTSITLVSTSGVVDGTFSISGTSVIFTPSADLAPNEVYTLTVNAGITDPAGNHLDPVFTADFETLRGPAFILGEVYDDTLSQPLEGATAEVLAINGEAPDQTLVTVSDTMGRFSLSHEGAVGSAVLWIYKEGYSSVLRRAILQPNASHTIFDARLTPVQTNALTAVNGGSIGAGDTALAIPANALPEDMDISFAELGTQGMGYRLPIGWSPLYGVDTAPWGVELGTPATIIMKNYWGFGSSAEFVAARFDSQALAWVSVPAAVTTDTITIEVSTLGQYFILLPDTLPEMPPIPQTAGEALLPSMAAMPDSGTADVAVNPPSVVSKEGVRGLTTVVLTTQNIVPSGTHLEARISERYSLTNGQVVTTEPFTMDVLAYAKPDDNNDMTLIAEFPATPSRYYPLGTLAFGAVNIDMALPSQEETTDENVIGDNGGTITGTDGTEIIIPPDSLTDGTVITLDELGEGDLPVTASGDLAFIGAFTLSLNGGSFVSGAFPQFVLPASVNEGDTVIITEVVSMHGISAQTAVAVGHTAGGRVMIDRCITTQCIASGSYAFYKAGRPIADMSGQVTKNTLPAGDILIEINNMPFRALTNTLGMYHILSFEGDWLVTATEPGTGLAASDTGTVAGGSALTVNLTLLSSSPEVVSVMPPDKALSVALATNIEVRLSEPVDPATVSISSFQVLEELPGISDPPAQVAGRISLTEGNTVLVFTPEMDLVSNTIYRVRLNESILDTYGEPLVAFESVFTTAEVLGQEALEPHQLTASLPDENGQITIRGGAGLAAPGTYVVLFNRSATSNTNTIEANTDGSFEGKLTAAIGDKVEVQVEDLLGNVTILDPGIWQDPDGTAVVGPDGGTIYGPGDVTTYIPEGAFDEFLAIRVAMVAEDAVSEVQMHPELKTAGVFQIESGGAVPNEELKISVPAPEWITPEHQILLARVVNIRGVEELTLSCPAVLRDGRIYSTSPPFEGVMGDGTYELVSWIDPAKGTAYVKVDVWKSMQIDTYIAGDYYFVYDVPYQSKQTIVVTIPVDRQYNVDLTTLDGEVLDTVSVPGPPERGEFYPENIELIYDPDPPTVLPASIPEGSIASDSYLAVDFSEALDPSTVNKNTVSVKDSNGHSIEGNIYLANDGRTIVFDPLYGYKFCETYTLHIEGVLDWGGNHLQGQYGNGFSTTFTTFCPRMLASAPATAAMAIDTYKNYVAVKGWDPSSPVDMVHSSHLWIFDITNPVAPVEAGGAELGGYIQDLKILKDATVYDYSGNAHIGDFAVAVGGRDNTYSELDLIDITNPASMNMLGGVYLSWSPQYGSPPSNIPAQSGASYAVSLLGTNAYVATNGIGIQAVNLLEVKLPVEGLTWDIISAMQEKALGGTYMGSSYSSVSSVRNNILAVKNGTLSILGPSLNLLGQLGSLNFPYLVEGVAAFPMDTDNDGRMGTAEDNDGDLVFAVNETIDLAFISTIDGIVVVDVTNTSAPKKIDLIPIQSGVVKVDRAKRIAYTTGLSIISLKGIRFNTPPDQMGFHDYDGDEVDDRLLYSMPEASGLDIALSEDATIAYMADYSHNLMKVVQVREKDECTLPAGSPQYQSRAAGRQNASPWLADCLLGIGIEEVDPDFPDSELEVFDYYPALGDKVIKVVTADTDLFDKNVKCEASVVASTPNNTPVPAKDICVPLDTTDTTLSGGDVKFLLRGQQLAQTADQIKLKFYIDDEDKLPQTQVYTYTVKNNANTTMDTVMKGEAVYVYEGSYEDPKPSVSDSGETDLQYRRFDYVQELLNQVVPRKRSVTGFELLDESGIYDDSTANAVDALNSQFNMPNKNLDTTNKIFDKLMKDYNKTSDDMKIGMLGRIVDKELLVGKASQDTDVLINGASGNTINDSGLYELYENVVVKFVSAMIREAERFAGIQHPDDPDEKLPKTDWVSRDGKGPAEHGAGMSYSWAGRQSIDEFNEIEDSAIDRKRGVVEGCYVKFSKKRILTINTVDGSGIDSGKCSSCHEKLSLPSGDEYKVIKIVDDTMTLPVGVGYEGDVKATGPGNCEQGGYQKYPGLHSSEWNSSQASYDIVDMKTGQITESTTIYPQFNGDYWAGTECSNLAQRSIVAGKDAPGVDLQMEVLSPYLTSQAFCEIPNANGDLVDSKGNPVEPTAFCYGVNLGSKEQKKMNEKKLRKGDLIVYDGHISIMYSDEACKGSKCDYEIIHAYGVNGYTDEDGVYHFMRKVIRMPNQIIYGNNNALMPNPTGFGRIKLWD